MRNRRQRPILVLLALASSIQIAQAQQMNAFTPPGGNFAVYMQGTPITKSANIGTGTNVHCYAHDEKSGAYWVTSCEVPWGSSADTDLVNRSLNGACSGAVAGMGATESRRNSVTLAGGYPGRQIEGTLPNGQGLFRMRMYLVGNQLFQLVVAGNKAYLQGAAPNRFLASLSVTPLSATHSVVSASASRSQQISADMQRQREQMQAQSAALHQKVQENQDRVRKDMEAAHARQVRGW